MKSIRSILAGITGLFAMLFLTSCGSAGESAPEPVTESFTVLLVVDEENRSLLIGGKADGSGEAATVSVRNLDITGPDGTAFDFAGLRPGHIIDLTWDGWRLETYPAQIQGIQAVSVTGEQPPEWVNPIDSDPFFDSWRNAASGDSPYSSMPSLQVEYQTETGSSSVPSCLFAGRGTSSWYEDGEGVCVDSLHPLEWEEDRIPTIRRSAALEASLRFSREPDSFTVRRWAWKQRGDTGAYEDSQEQSLSGAALTIPAKGEFLYEVTALWEEGTVTYVFAAR